MKETVKRAIKYLKSYINLFVLNIILSLLSGIAVAAPAWIFQNVIDDVLIKKDERMLYLMCGAILGIYIIKGIVFYYRSLISETISSGIVFKIREELQAHLQTLSLKFYSNIGNGELIARFSNDIQRFKDLLLAFFSIILKSLTLMILLIRLFGLDWKLTLLSLVFIPLLSKIVRKFTKKLYKTGTKMQEEIANITSYLQESISGVRIIKAFAMEEKEKTQFGEINKKNYQAAIKNKKVSARVTPIIDLFNAISIILILIFGGKIVLNGLLTVGEFISFLIALGLMSDPIRTMGTMYNKIITNLSSVNRIFDLMDIEADIKEKENALELENVKGEIKIKGLSFAYEEKEGNVLNNINIDANLGEVVALVGKSGSGKTTLVNLIPRFYDIENGEILIDGHNIKDVTIKSLRKNIGIVPQDTFLFTGTIADNIAYGKENASEEEIKEAAKMANALEFINEFPNGLKTEVGERGNLLSGGQKQRVAIARAILKNPQILILDEATSALDTESERLVQDALDKLMKNKTTFVIAHRLSTIINADKIIVMEDGKILEVGNHKELLAKKAKYKELYEKQFGEEL